MLQGKAAFYMALTVSSVLDWALSIVIYLKINHTFGIVMFVMAFLSDIARGYRYEREAK